MSALEKTEFTLTKNEKRHRVIHNMCSSILYNISVIFFGLLLPRMYLTRFGSEVNGLDSTIKQIFSCLSLLEAGVGLASQQAYYRPVALGEKKRINGIFAATNHYYCRTGIVYLLVTLLFAAVYPSFVKSQLPYGVISAIIIIYGIPGIVSYFVQGKYRSFLEVEGKSYIITYITTVTLAMGNLLRMGALMFTDNILLVQITYCVPTIFQVIAITCYIHRVYPWMNAKGIPDLKALSQKNSVLLHQLSGIVFNNTDTILISSICGLAQASVYTVYMLFFSNIEKLFYSVTNSFSFRLGQLFQVDQKRFCKYYNLYESMYIMISFVLFTVVALFLLPIIGLYTRGVTDISYRNHTFIVLFTIVNVLSGAKEPANLVLTYSGHFDKTRHQAILEMLINICVSIPSVLYFGMIGCLMGTIAALIYRYIVITVYTQKTILGKSPLRSFSRLFINGLICAVLLSLLGFDRCNADNYFMVCLKGALYGIWIFPLYLVVNGLIERENRQLLIDIFVQQINRK